MFCKLKGKSYYSHINLNNRTIEHLNNEVK